MDVTAHAWFYGCPGDDPKKELYFALANPTTPNIFPKMRDRSTHAVMAPTWAHQGALMI